MSGRGGLYPGPGGEMLHGDGKPVGQPTSSQQPSKRDRVKPLIEEILSNERAKNTAFHPELIDERIQMLRDAIFKIATEE